MASSSKETTMQPAHQESEQTQEPEGSTSSTNNKKHEVSIPLVRVDLDSITYAPVVKQPSTGKLRFKKTNGQSKENRKTILQDITTSIEPFRLTAWMGPSGSGKSSLLSVVANLADPKDILQGQIRVNRDVGSLPKRLVGVVWQDDLLLSNLTVEETIYFSARLKTPCAINNEEVRHKVHACMKDLGLWQVRHSLIGSSSSHQQRGISGGERKRVAVACELVVQPSVLLLDEVTSGLDATTAMSLVQTLQQLAHDHGHAIAMVIHQPRTEIFNLLDHLLLLNYGRVVYNGPPKSVRNYLESIPTVTPLPPETGIADWLMDTIQADVHDNPDASLANYWAQTQQQQQQSAMGNDKSSLALMAPTLLETQQESTSDSSDEERNSSLSSPRQRMSSLKELQQSPNYVTPFRMQLRLLLKRTLKQMRGEKLTSTAIYLTAAYTFFSALFWWQLPDTTARIYERNSLLFFMLIAQSNGIVTASISVFQRERALLRRERAKKLYGVLPFFLAKTVSDMTNNVLLPCVYGCITYWACGFRPTAAAFAQFVLIFYLTMSAAQSMGLFLSVLIPSMQLALILAPPITLFFMIMGGFYIPFDNMHPGVKWLSWLSFARYGYTSMLVNEFGGRDIACADDEDVSVTVTGGDEATCPLPGDDVLESLGIHGVSTNYWFGVGIIALMQIAFRLASYVVLRRTNK